MDIRHFYDNIRIDILMRELRIRIKDEWFLYIIKLCLTGFKKGIPLGFYISQWLANYLLEPLDKLITKVLGLDKEVRYMDDIIIYNDNKKILHNAIAVIKQFLGHRFRLKLKHNYQVCKFYYIGKKKKIGRKLDFMGFVFCRENTTIRKNIKLSATRTAAKLHNEKESGRGYYLKHLKAMLSYMGWFKCTDSYDIYKDRIKPFVNIGKLKKIVSRLDRRKNNETVDRRKMLGKAERVTACCA